MTDFYEDDEPIEDVLAAFDAGEKGLTAPPIGVVLTGPFTTKLSGNRSEFPATRVS